MSCRKSYQLTAFPVFMLLLNGCSIDPLKKLHSAFYGDGATLYAAAPLDMKYVVPTSQKTPIDASALKPGEEMGFLMSAVNDSIRKCQGFVNFITEGQAVSNVYFDTLSILLSGLASVFTPVNTVRSLTAASTISQGSKGAVNSNFFQQMSIAIFIKKIEDSYYSEYKNYLSNLPSVINIGKELARINLIHRQCSITYAAASLNAPVFSPTLPLTQASLYNGATFQDPNGKIYRISRVSGRRTMFRWAILNPAAGDTENTADQDMSGSDVVEMLNARGARPK